MAEDLHETLFRRVEEHWGMINLDYMPYFANLYSKGNYWQGEQVNKDPDSAISLLRAKIKAGQYYNYSSPRIRTDDYRLEYNSRLPGFVNEIENARLHVEEATDDAGLYEDERNLGSKFESFVSRDYSYEHIDFSKYGEGKFNYVELRNYEHNPFRQKAKQIIEETHEYNNYYLLLPETYDLILKSDRPYNAQLIKYGLFLAYLDEIFYREKTTPQSRYIFTAKDIRNITKHLFSYDIDDIFVPNRRMIASSVYPFPFIPTNANLILPPTDVKFHSIFLNRNFDLDTFQRLILPDWTPTSGNHVRYHVNGSTLVFKIQDKTPPEGIDVDIRIGYVDNERQISDQDFDESVQHLIDVLGLDHLTRVDFSKEKYKYIAEDTELNIKYDIFRANFGFVSNYHVPAVRCDLSPGGFLFYPSSVVANLIGYSLDLRMFVNEKINPFEIVKKYTNRGYSFFLNDNEIALWLEYIARTENVTLHTMTFHFANGQWLEEPYIFIPFICQPPFSNPGYNEWIYSVLGRGSLELLQICPLEHKETLMKHIMGVLHNNLIARKKYLGETDANLQIPLKEDFHRFTQFTQFTRIEGEENQEDVD